MAPPAERFYATADSILQAIVDGWPDDATPLPDRLFVGAGPPGYDGELVCVHLARHFAYDGDIALELLTGAGASAGYALRGATYQVTVLRRVPVVSGERTVRVPSVEQEQAAALTVMSDAQVVMSVLAVAGRDGTLAGCGSVAFEPWVVIPAEGGLGGGQLGVRVGV